MIKKILIVDDERAVRSLFKDVINMHFDHKIEVTTAENGMVALQKVEQTDFALIFSDILMPGMNGLEFLIRAKKIRPATTFIMMSGDAGGIKPEELVELAGAYEFMEKPIKLMRIIKLIKKFL